MSVSNSKISRMRKMLTAYSGPRRKNVRNCAGPTETFVGAGVISSGSTRFSGSGAATGSTDLTGSAGSTGAIGASELTGGAGASWLSDVPSAPVRNERVEGVVLDGLSF